MPTDVSIKTEIVRNNNELHHNFFGNVLNPFMPKIPK